MIFSVDNHRPPCETIDMYWIPAGLLGLAIGSFLNVLIDRLPREESIVFGRSRCDYCHKPLRWYELIPVVSWLWQSGRCRRCHRRLSLQYPLIELTTAVCFISVFYGFPPPGEISGIYYLQLAGWFGIASSGIVIFVTDFKNQIIPDSMLVLLLISAFLARPFPGSYGLLRLGAAGMVSGLFFYALWLITRGRGMGFGDVKLAAVLGAVLGYPEVVIAGYVAFLTGAAYGVILMIRGAAGLKSRVAFGPFLLIGAVVAYYWSGQILHWWGFI